MYKKLIKITNKQNSNKLRDLTGLTVKNSEQAGIFLQKRVYFL